MKKLIAGLSLLAGLIMGTFFVQTAHATGVAVAPKQTYALNYTTTAGTVTANASTLYEVTMSTGAAGEFVSFFDTNTAVGIYSGGPGTAIAATTVSAASGYKMRVIYSSTTQNTQIKFDPPIIFQYGMQVVDSASSGASLITFEYGVGSGQ